MLKKSINAIKNIAKENCAPVEYGWITNHCDMTEELLKQNKAKKLLPYMRCCFDAVISTWL